MRWAVLLAGGSGTRFWPLSTPANPKQLLPLAGPRSSAEDAVDRLAGLIPRERTLVVAGASLGQRLQERLELPAENMLIEPRAASTAPALIWATWEAQRRDPDAEVLSLHADWVVGDAAAFRETADMALGTARRHDRLVTVGMVPSRPETGYGYIVPGPPLDDASRSVARFSEKPDAATALDLMAAGALWNSGLFAWTATRLLAEAREHTPEVARALPALSAGGRPSILPRGGADLHRRRAAGAEPRGRRGARRLRVGRRGHLAGAGPGAGQGPDGQRGGRRRGAARVPGLCGLDRWRADRPVRRAGDGRRAARTDAPW